jgi:glycosyltransferase involved in cell wall biosynthesis
MPDEVLVWDDHSPEDPRRIVEGFRSRFAHLVYRRHERNKGMPGNLNDAVAHATGDEFQAWEWRHA